MSIFPYATYIIEIHKPDEYFKPGEYFAEIICEGPEAPAGEVPAWVEDHARLLARIQGPGTRWRVGYHRPLRIKADGSKESAWTTWLTDPARYEGTFTL